MQKKCIYWASSFLAVFLMFFIAIGYAHATYNNQKCKSINPLASCSGCSSISGYYYDLGQNSGKECGDGGAEDNCIPKSKTCYTFSIGTYNMFLSSSCTGQTTQVRYLTAYEHKVTQCD